MSRILREIYDAEKAGVQRLGAVLTADPSEPGRTRTSEQRGSGQRLGCSTGPPSHTPAVWRGPTGRRSGADVGREVLSGRVERSATNASGVPSKTIRPPSWPAPGTRSMISRPRAMTCLVVRDDDDRLAGVDEPVEQTEQLLHVGEVESGGRLVEDVDVALLSHLGGELEALPLAAGQRRERLAEDVAEPDVGESVEDGVRGQRTRLAEHRRTPRPWVTDIASTSLMSRPPR